MDHGMAGDVPALIAVNVSLPSERHLFTRLDRMAQTISLLTNDDPAVLLIGEAVRRHVPEDAQAMRGVEDSSLSATPVSRRTRASRASQAIRSAASA